MLTGALTAKADAIAEIKPFMKATFYIKDEQTLDEFWSFMMKEEGLTKTIEFIMHICSEVLYETNEEITVEVGFFRYISYFKVSNHLFSKKAMQHYLKIRAFISVEIDDEAVFLKSIRENDRMDCKFCKMLKDDDPKVKNAALYEPKPQNCGIPFFEIDAEPHVEAEGILNIQRCPVDLEDEFGSEELRFLSEELEELENELFDTLDKIDEKSDITLLHPLSLKTFIYSQKLLASVEFYELSISIRRLSFLIQKLFFANYEKAKKPLFIYRCMISDIREWRKETLNKSGKINAHYLDASLAASLSQLENMIGGIK